MEKYSLDIVNKTLTMTKAFADEVSKGFGEEYELYLKLAKDIPNLTVIKKTHRTPSKYVSKISGEKTSCNQFKGLTYKKMEGFISCLNNDDVEVAYNMVKAMAIASKKNAHIYVAEWFVKQFPKFRNDPMFYLFNDFDVIDFKSYIKEAETNTAEIV